MRKNQKQIIKELERLLQIKEETIKELEKQNQILKNLPPINIPTQPIYPTQPQYPPINPQQPYIPYQPTTTPKWPIGTGIISSTNDFTLTN